jgi:predicted MPP superfamily phosphohydrolase
MKNSKKIIEIINRLPKGYVFTYGDFINKVKSKQAIIKTLNRLASKGKIVKISKGKFYKPEKSSFGQLKPDVYQLVKDLLEKDGKIIGYLTGYSILNKFGITTQISNLIQIGRKTYRPSLKRGDYKVSFVIQKNTITKENIPFLQILDVLKLIKKIPDTPTKEIIERIKEVIKNLNKEEQEILTKLSLKYPPYVRALLGALLEELNKKSLVNVLRESLNPITSYKIDSVYKILSTAENWNIK